MKPRKIAAVTVNHNTSGYTELMLRSLFAHHPTNLDLSTIVYDNASTDDTSALLVYTQHKGIPVVQTGFDTSTENNSHGEILSRFVLNNPHCTHYLFLDADVCFIEDKTIHEMLIELEASSNAFGIAPRMSWDGVEEIPVSVRENNPDLYDARLHPCCALVKNTPLFQTVVREIGLSCVKYLWAGGDEYIDTFKLMTRVMKTHGMKHRVSTRMVIHFFSVSYIWEPTKHLDEEKARRRDALLASYRSSTPWKGDSR